MSEIIALLHPPITSFPFVLIWVVVSLDFLGWLQKRDYLFMSLCFSVITLVFAFIAYQTGHQASQYASLTFVVSDEVIGQHFFWAKVSLFCLVATVIFKGVAYLAKFNKGAFKIISALMAFCTALLLVFVGHLGGKLVFDYGAGVKAKLESKLD